MITHTVSFRSNFFHKQTAVISRAIIQYNYRTSNASIHSTHCTGSM